MKKLEDMKGFGISLREMRDRSAEKRKHEARQEMVGLFTLAEREGEVYVLCDGVAIRHFSPETSVEAMVATLGEMRTAACDFENLRKRCGD